MTTLAILAAFLVGNVLFSALFLWLVARWVKASKPTFLRAIGATMAMMVAGIAIVAGVSRFHNRFEPQGMQVLLIEAGIVLVSQMLASWLIIVAMVRITFLRAVLVWLGTWIPAIATSGLIIYLIRPFVFEAFIVPSNPMAPAVIGWHQERTCPNCGGMLIVPLPDPEDMERFGVMPDEDVAAICTVCRKTTLVHYDGTVGQRLDVILANKLAMPERWHKMPAVKTPDRILANKLLTPQRWDMIVFRYPENPAEKFVMRLVGLPGEKVYIKEGAVWIDDVRTEPPAELTGLHYTTELSGGFPVALGTPENPLHLGATEYCVLGDFSPRCNDSRSWGPLPSDHIEGVVTVCYWPVSRWRIFR
jgi:signal peptidase I